MYRLLVVDDEEAVVDNLALTMPWSRLGISEVFKAFSAEEALGVLETETIHIVITDVRMPGASGLELAAQIGARWSRIKCLILSGYADFDYARQALQSETVDYLLKPIRENDLLRAVERAIGRIEREWEAVVSQRRAEEALEQHLPLLRSNLLGELLQGKRYSADRLRQKLALYGLPFEDGDPFSLLLVRLEEDFAGRDFQRLSLLEYAIVNIAEELGERDFEFWSRRDVHDHLVLCVKPKNRRGDGESALAEGRPLKLAERLAVQLQENVKRYLKVGVSVVIAEWSAFPARIAELYEQALAVVRERLGRDGELILVAGTRRDGGEGSRVGALSALYEPPTLLHLLDAGRWEAVREKLQTIFAEAAAMRMTSEHAMELFFALSGAVLHIAHKSGFALADAIGGDAAQLAQPQYRTLAELRGWAMRVFGKIEELLERDMRMNRRGIVDRVRSFIEEELSRDVSIQSIAEHIGLHPVYLSRIYKLETGESIGQYLLRLRMEKAAALLKSGTDKIMDVASRLGYQNATYFSKVFKDYFGQTPQQYRDDGAYRLSREHGG
ncbi:response regulator [Paenibacillus sp. GCM10023250]|uniref:response regulator n=1 Tax=Paenibacillus sp. GCM10023250 TaxID=3252648 RepID=UPI00361434DA